jgi:hypothetical protein
LVGRCGGGVVVRRRERRMGRTVVRRVVKDDTVDPCQPFSPISSKLG